MPIPDYLEAKRSRQFPVRRRPSASITDPPWNLSQLEDVEINRPEIGDGLFHDKSSGLWRNRPMLASVYSSGGFGIGLHESYGLSWTDLGQLGGQIQVRSFAYLGNGIVLAGTGTATSGKIFRSTDYGATWSDLGQLGSEASVYSLAYLGNGIALAGTYSGGKIFRSTDYGATWSDLGSIDGAFDVVYTLAYLGNGIVLAGTGACKVFRSTDYGVSWSLIERLESDGNELYVVCSGYGITLAGTTSGKIFRSTDYGATWSDLVTIGTTVYSFSYLCYGIVLAGTGSGGKIFRSALVSGV